MATYRKGDNVFCYHGPVPYPAKILDVRKDKKRKEKESGEEKVTPYKVHYAGWNTRHDEWVGSDRLLEFNEENEKFAKEKLDNELQEELDEQGGKKKTKKPARPPGPNGAKRKAEDDGDSSRASSPSRDSKAARSSRASVASDHTPSVTKSEGKTRKGRAKNVEPRKEFSSRPEIKITLPQELKQNLVDDWDMISRQYRILRLPSEPTVDELVEDYKREKQADEGVDKIQRDLFCESADGIRAHFNAMLGTQLLYKLERAQYADLRQGNPDFCPSATYGFIHLLRLFVRMGTMLAYTPWNQSSIKRILDHILDFVDFLKRNNAYARADYDVATLEYQKRVWS